MTEGEYCLKCKTVKTDCEINCKGYKEFKSSVPWCFKKDKRLVHLDWCEGCEHHLPKKIIP